MKRIFFVLKIFVYLFISGTLILSSLYLYAYLSPTINIENANKMFIYDGEDNLIFAGSSSNKWIKLNDINKSFLHAIISSEDKNFYNHNGFDYLRIIKAMYLNIKNDEIVQGASTISQQYVKNLYLVFDQTWERKIEEAFLTLELETHYSKDEILEGYVNTINYGHGNYGIENASNFYFNKSAEDLSLEEAVILAAIPKNPNNYNPITNYDLSIKRADMVLKSMLKNEYISKDEYENIDFSKVEVIGKNNSNNLTTLMYYQDAVINELHNIKGISSALISSSGLNIYTNLDMEAQSLMEESINKNMLDDNTQVASIIIDPKNGGVVALAGGRNYYKSQFNRAINSYRQVGSTIKPILYYAALENGFTGSSTFLSEPTTFIFSNKQSYSPGNYNNTYANKNITMAAAISYSENIYAVKTHLFLGENVLVDTAKLMGIKQNLSANPSLALGSSEMRLIDLANAYSTLASGGYNNDTHFIRKITDNEGRVLYEKDYNQNLVINPNSTYIINELLTTTYNSSFIDYNYPTISTISSRISRKYAAKSGSTGSDYLMVGYNNDLLMLVWAGNDNNEELNKKYSSITKNIWVETMENVLKDTESSWYKTPKNVIGKLLNPITGESGTNNNYLFYYLKGSEPITNIVSKKNY